MIFDSAEMSKSEFIIEITTLPQEITCHMGSHSVTEAVSFQPLP